MMRCRRRAAGPVATVSLLLAAACTGGGAKPDAADAADTAAAAARASAYLSAWGRGDDAAAGALTSAPARAAKALRAARQALDATALTVRGEAVTVHGSTGAAAFTASWSFTGVARPWTYTGSLPLVETPSGWQVRWARADIHPALTGPSGLSATRVVPERAGLLDDHGRPLFTRLPVVDVGIEPSKVHDLPSLTRTLAAALHVDAAPLAAAATAAKPDQFVPVITLRRPAYDAVRARIHNLPGTVFQTGTRLLASSAQFAPTLLGTVGRPTADQLRTLGPGHLATDDVGRSGLQEALNGRLTGTAGVTVATGPTRIGGVPAVAGRAVRTTIDVATQNAADAALAAVKQPAAIVAVRVSTGAILADAASESAPFDIGLAGEYPPGSTFKIVTATSVLEHKVAGPTTPVPCPGQIIVDGKLIHNENSFDLGTVPVHTAFAHSCNTSFARLAGELTRTGLSATAGQFGVGAGWSLPVPSFSGSVPEPESAAEQASDGFGQGRVLVSPLTMALAAATVAHGSAVTPQLLAGQPAKAAHPPASPPAAVLAQMRPLMRSVVTEGTATELSDVPGGPVSGKTGTAEYGAASPPRTHGWFAGYQGDVAVAVFLQGNAPGNTDAVPIARAFLTNPHR